MGPVELAKRGGEVLRRPIDFDGSNDLQCVIRGEDFKDSTLAVPTSFPNHHQLVHRAHERTPTTRHAQNAPVRFLTDNASAVATAAPITPYRGMRMMSATMFTNTATTVASI